MSQLQRRLTLYGLTMVAVGSCIGAGIFATPGEIVATFPHAGWVLVLWLVGGLITLTGALTFAELGGMFPKAGGIYVYLKEAYGKLPAFLYGWVTLLVVNTGSLAALGLIFAKYLTFYIPLTEAAQIWVAVSVVGGLTIFNIFGINTSQWIISVFTTTKLVALLVVILLASMLRDQTEHVHVWSLGENLPSDWLGLLLTALIGVLWSFGGWHHATYLAGETRHPQRNVPRAMLLGAVIVTLTYVLTNLAYLWLLPLETIAGTERVAGDALEAVIQGGGKGVALLIGVSVFGTIAIYTMSAPRIYFAMARDGVFFSFLARLHPRFKTPANAMATQAIWAIFLLLVWGQFHDLITYVTFIDIAFMTLAGIGIFIFRAHRADINRPYKAWGYPIVPGLYVLITFAFLVNTLVEKPVQAIAGLVALAAGIIVYYLIKYARRGDA